MFISIMQNVVNILVSLLLVYGFGMKIEGVAIGTVVAQYAGLVLAIISRPSPIPLPIGRGVNSAEGNYSPPSREGRGRGSSINIDIFLRTLCLVAVNLYFTSVGARQGAVILSVNTVLLQLYLLFSYFMDGFAYAGEALCGRFYGAHNAPAFHETLRRLFLWTALVTVVYTFVYLLGGQWIVGILTDSPQVIATAEEYMGWACLIPVAGAVAFIWDGVFIGLTATRGMLVSSVLAALLFFATEKMSAVFLQNHGLWLAQILYLAARGLVQTLWYRKKLLPIV
jgi:MATE family multidrug resistance protein